MQGEKQRVTFPRVCAPLRSLLIRPRGQQCVFDQVSGLLPVRRETVEGIDGGRVQCRHPAGVRCGTHSQAGCKARNQLVCNGAHCARLGPGGSYSMPGHATTHGLTRAHGQGFEARYVALGLLCKKRPLLLDFLELPRFCEPGHRAAGDKPATYADFGVFGASIGGCFGLLRSGHAKSA